MPKVGNTKKQKAEELYNRIIRGVSFSESYDGKPFTTEEAKRQYTLWVNSWIREDLINLIPELKHLKSD